VAPFFQNLRRRKVVQWTLAYLAGAFALLQLADILSSTFAWPALVMRALTALLAIGVLGAIVLAWYHGERGDQRVGRTEILLLGGVLLAAASGATILSRGREDAAAGASPEPASVAVLPFVNLSSDREQEFFGDGITEEILNVLAKVPGLRVPARTSSFSFKGQNVPVSTIARQLNVAHIVEGSVRKSGDKLRIKAQLIDARTDAHLWSETFDRDLADVFAVQEEIARSVAEALQLRLQANATSGIRTGSPHAHEEYLKGLYLWHRRHRDALPLAIQHFKKAIDYDSLYAPAHAGLALTYAILPQYGGASRETATREGKAAARRAIELNSRLAEPHAALGQIAAEYELDLRSAVAHLNEAIRLNPAYATARMWRAEVYMVLGERELALADSEQALRLDPLSVVMQAQKANALYELARYAEAEAIYRAVLKRDPDAGFGVANLVRLLIHTGRAAASREVAHKGELALVIEAALSGHGNERAEVIRKLNAAEAAATASTYDIAFAYLSMNEIDSTFAVLNRAAERRDLFIQYAAYGREFEKLHTDPRFPAFRERLGVPEN
jgi:adenylate cyclase